MDVQYDIAHGCSINISMNKLGKTKPPAKIPQAIIDSLLASVSLSDLVAQSTPLVKIDGVHKALCPFHISKETTKTLCIDKADSSFSCSVCKFHGSVIGWMMYHDGLSFQESILELSNRANLDVSHFIDDDARIVSHNARCDLFDEVKLYFCDMLKKHDVANDYILHRQLSQQTLERYDVGYSSDHVTSFDVLFKSKLRSLWKEGLLIRLSDGQYRKRFRNRLMFPIKNVNGETIGFGGRALNDATPKYLNSPSSPSFDKSSILYGLYETLQENPTPSSLILVEGYIDVLTLFQHGFKGAVATLGTSPSEQHIKSIFKHTNTLLACFDGDSAGLKAAKRLLYSSLPYLSDENQIRFVILPVGHDPDSYLTLAGVDAFEAMLDSAVSVETFIYQMLTQTLDIDSIGGKARLALEAKNIIGDIESDSLRTSVITMVENAIGVPWLDHPSA